jgi:predicted RNA-binding Zn-ribbon protein involved in translation (DUF1610 family)
MSFRFRQSFKILPGLKLNLSKTGLSASIGGAPFTLNLGNCGLMATASIPGTGISFRQHLSGGQMAGALGGQNPSQLTSPNLNPPQSDFIVEPEPGVPPIRQIRSASTEQMTSASLSELKDLIQTAYEQHEETSREFLKANEENKRASKRYSSWENGFLFKKLFKKSFENRRVIAEIATAKAVELEEQLRLAKIATEIDLAPEQAEPFFRMRDDFSALAGCNVIWDVTAERATDKYRERTTAVNSIARKKVSFNLRGCDFIEWEEQVPHLENANGGDIYLYPGFILYRASKTAFSMIAFRDVVFVYKPYRFIEEDGVPSDSKVVGQEWAKTNKDGSRDKRFAGNYQIPIALYGELILKSATGLDEKFVVSNPERLERFAASWKSFAASFDNQITVKIEPTENPESAPVESSTETPSQPKIVGTDVHFECQFCKQPIEVNAEAAGQEFRCPGCGGSLVVPQCS